LDFLQPFFLLTASRFSEESAKNLEESGLTIPSPAEKDAGKGSHKRHKIAGHLIRIKAGQRVIRALAFIEEEGKTRIK
jgi:hypothetical protein|tara:strand:- start:138 stop:371 length:234 start_codon:yes stop_codon:yes gene_type:complete